MLNYGTATQWNSETIKSHVVMEYLMAQKDVYIHLNKISRDFLVV